MSTNGELLSSAMSEEPVERVETLQVETEQQDDNGGQPRDEGGRFAAKQAPDNETQQKEAFIPSGRLREEREAREAAERRFQDSERSWQQRFAQLEARLPKADSRPQIDPIERVLQDPMGLVRDTAQPLIDPINQQIAGMREFYSQRDAIREHGQEKVQEAYRWIAEGMQLRDPVRVNLYQRAMSGMDPWGDIVGEHQKSNVYSQIGNDPAAWFAKQLDERLTDQKFAGELMQKIQGSLQQQVQSQDRNQIQLPPNLRRAPGARSGSEESGDMSNGALLSM